MQLFYLFLFQLPNCNFFLLANKYLLTYLLSERPLIGESTVRGSHLTYKVASKYLNVRKRVEVVDRNKDDPLSSLAFQ